MSFQLKKSFSSLHELVDFVFRESPVSRNLRTSKASLSSFIHSEDTFCEFEPILEDDELPEIIEKEIKFE